MEPVNNVLLSNKEICIIPTHSELTSAKSKGEIDSYMIAIRDFGNKQWKYMNGVPSSKKDLFKTLIPELPDDFELPEQKVIVTKID